MTKAELARKKNEFVVKMARKHEIAEEYIIRLLKAKDVVYNISKEVEIEKMLDGVIDAEIERRRAKLLSMIDQTKPEKCWLAQTPGIMCPGEIVRKAGELPQCDKGGIRHFLVFRSGRGDPVGMLGRIKAVEWEHNATRQAELKAWKEAMAQPFDIERYRSREEDKPDGDPTLFDAQNI